MISIHTFEFKIPLKKSEQKKIKKKLGIPEQKECWTEHRYNDRGITIILYKGKRKGFIYLKYIVNLKRLFVSNDYLHLLEPTPDNISCLWTAVRETWKEIGCCISFDRFYLSRLDFTCDIYLQNDELLHEYIRLLRKSILLPFEKVVSVEGIFHGKDVPCETIRELQENCCKYEITNCEDIQCYNKLYQLNRAKLPIPEDIACENPSILRIELQIHKTKRITELLQDAHMYNSTIEEQFSFFIKNAPTFLIGRLERLYMPGKYRKKSYVLNYIKNDHSIKNKNRERALQLVNDANKYIPLGRCIELDRQNGNIKKRKKLSEYLSYRNISPICISSKLTEYDTLPSIFDLIDKEISQIL